MRRRTRLPAPAIAGIGPALVAAAAVLWGGGAAAQAPPPACTPTRAGQVACLAGKLCECRFERGGSLTGRPDGHRWDCGALRPGCGGATAPPPPAWSLPGGGGGIQVFPQIAPGGWPPPRP